jgi:hypothetical protein
MNETEVGWVVDLSELLPEEYKNKISTVTYNTYNQLYIKDPIGKIYYSDPSEYYTYRDNIAISAFDYKRVKFNFKESLRKIE